MNRQSSYEESVEGKLYLVPTPIGNLDDMTFRAIKTLKDVDLIAAEDTRNTQKLLNHFEIATSQMSFHEHNTTERIPQLINKLLDGESIAQVSDAGMPSISDPGSELVAAAIEQNIPVIPLPGASAVLPALIGSGIMPQPFTFIGFLPRKKKELREQLELLKTKKETFIIYESPHRLKNFINELSKIFEPERKITLARELTKRFEEFIRGDIGEIKEWVDKGQIRGEFVIIIQGSQNEKNQQNEPEWSTMDIKSHVEYFMNSQDLSSKMAIKEVSKVRKLPKSEVYAVYHEL